MKQQPQDYINRASLGVTVATNWANFYPNYVVNFCTQAAFAQLFTDFLQKAHDNTQQDQLKKSNTANLKEVNDKISKGATRLKEYIRDAYPNSYEVEYSAYGLEKGNKGTITFPTDNDSRKQRLAILLQKLNEPNNPIATRNQGLVYWKDLIDTHSTEWDTSKNLKSGKSQLSSECKALHEQAGEWLKKLHKQISIDFNKNQIDNVRRTFGFLSETYK